MNGEELPEGWVCAFVGDLADVGSGKFLKRTEYGQDRTADAPYPVAGAGGPIGWTAQCNEPAPVMTLGRVGACGSLNEYDGPAWVTDNALVVRPKLDPFRGLLGLFFRTVPWKELNAGTSQPLITQTGVRALEVALPPLPEQRRIVEKVEALLADVNASRDRLSKVIPILKRFRQAVLAAACSGRLTEEWRAARAPSLDKTESLLRQALGKRRREAVEPTTDFDIDVPEGWLVRSMDQLCGHLTSGSRAWKPFYCDDGYGTFVMAQNVRPMQFDRTSRQGVAPPATDPERERTRVQADDILITIVGANTGDVCRVDAPVDDHFVCQSVALARPVVSRMSAFLTLWLNSPAHGQLQYRGWIYGEGRPHLSFDHLRTTLVGLPSLDEQAEIVRRVESLFALADAIEARVKAATARADKIPQAILSKAFRGELVPTEAELALAEGRTYETAAEMLVRVRAAEPPAGKAGKKSRGRKRTS